MASDPVLCMIPLMFRNRYALVSIVSLLLAAAQLGAADQPLPKVHIAKDGRSFETDAGQPFVPFGVNYYRPGTGWAPQVWKQFDAETTRKDFARMKELASTARGSFSPTIRSTAIPGC